MKYLTVTLSLVIAIGNPGAHSAPLRAPTPDEANFRNACVEEMVCEALSEPKLTTYDSVGKALNTACSSIVRRVSKGIAEAANPLTPAPDNPISGWDDATENTRLADYARSMRLQCKSTINR